MTNSKDKGSRNERSVAKLFNIWTGYNFARTPQSGGLRWHKKDTIGDIVCTDEIHSRKFPFSIECKFHADVEFSYLLDNTVSKKANKVTLFWEQAKNDAERAGKEPLLFIRRNMMKADTHFVVMNQKLYNSITSEMDIKFEPSLGIIKYKAKDLNLVFLSSVDFFKLPYTTCYSVTRKKLRQ